MEFDQLLIREKAFTVAMDFEFQPPSVNTHCILMCPNLFTYLSIVKPLRMEFDQLLVREKAFTFIVFASVFSYWFKSEPISVNTYYAKRYPKLLAYRPIVEPLRMEFDKLLVREQMFTFMVFGSVFSYWFKPELFSMKTHCLWSYPKLLAYLPIVEPLCMEFDQLLIREQASMASHLRTLTT